MNLKLLACAVLFAASSALPASAADYIRPAPAAPALAVAPTACSDSGVLGVINRNFDYRNAHYLHAGLDIVDIQGARELAYLPSDATHLVGRTYCEATAVLNDHRPRPVWYLIEFDDGFCRDRRQCRILRGRTGPVARLRSILHLRATLNPVQGDLCIRRLLAVTLALALCGPAPRPASAAENVAGVFDFYVLSLSWAASYCASAGAGANARECRRGARGGFVVHGLWPQNERGYPESCPSKFPRRVPRALAERYFDIMPGMSLIGHEWRAHGTCTGLDQASYFRLVRRAREAVRVPIEFGPAAPAQSVDPDRIEAAFTAANPGMQRDGIAVTCRSGRVEDVRICLTSSLRFRACPAVDAAGCDRSRVLLPKGRTQN